MRSSNKTKILGESSLMLDLMDQVSRLAPLNKPVLVIGERGTGKELVAERIHFLSERWDQAFLKLNCASMNENLLESELFGHEAGAFTGAVKRHVGRFERAEAGSLFLDELGTSSLMVQEKLLRVVEYGEFERVGGQQALQADVRLIAATNSDLLDMRDQKTFRADLLDRLAFDVIHIPPLRYRQDDILLLAEHFAQRMCIELGRDYFPGFSAGAQRKLLSYEWPGNVRELKNAVERSVYRESSRDRPIENMVVNPFVAPWHLMVEAKEFQNDKRVKQCDPRVTEQLSHQAVQVPDIASVQRGPVTANQEGLGQQVKELEQRLLLEALQKSGYNQKIAAEKLNLTYHQLRSQLRKFKMIPLKAFIERKNLSDESDN